MPSVLLQRLASGQARPVATAQLKLLVSFTPIPGPQEGLTQPQSLQPALHRVHRSSSSSSSSVASSSDEALSSIEGSSAQQAEPIEAANSHASLSQPTLQILEHQPQDRKAKKLEASPKHSAPNKHRDRQPTAEQRRRSSEVMAPIPDNERSAVSSAQAGQGSGQGRAGVDMQDVSERPGTPALTPKQALSRLIERAEQLREVIEAAAVEGWAPDQPPASSGDAHALQAAAEPARNFAQSREGPNAPDGNSAEPAEALDSWTREPSAGGHGQRSAPAAFQSSAGAAGDASLLTDARDKSSGSAEATSLVRAEAGQGPVMPSDGHAAVTPGEANSQIAKRSRLATGSVCRPAARRCIADSSHPKVGCYFG